MGTRSPILQEVLVSGFSSSDCHKAYSTLSNFASKFPEGMNSENTLCAGDEDGGKDACEVRIKIKLEGSIQ